MIILPAIDLLDGQAVRLLRGDYSKVTVYNPDPVDAALKFKSQGVQWLHIVDLDGAKSGSAVNFGVIDSIKRESGLKCEIGGGIRDLNTIERYLTSGLERVILGTAAVTKSGFVSEAVREFGCQSIAVGVDIKDNRVAIKGWQESADLDAFEFCEQMLGVGIKFIICTDISRDGAMTGANIGLYEKLKKIPKMNFIASGGVSSIKDVRCLSSLGLHGAIIGRAYYNGAVDLREAIEAATVKDDN